MAVKWYELIGELVASHCMGCTRTPTLQCKSHGRVGMNLFVQLMPCEISPLFLQSPSQSKLHLFVSECVNEGVQQRSYHCVKGIHDFVQIQGVLG